MVGSETEMLMDIEAYAVILLACWGIAFLAVALFHLVLYLEGRR